MLPQISVFRGNNFSFYSCQTLSSFQLIGGNVFVRGCVSCGPVSILGQAVIYLQTSWCFDGATFTATYGGFLDINGGDVQFVDGTAANAIEVDTGSTVSQHGNAFVWGLNNSFLATTFLITARAQWVFGNTPSIPGGATGDTIIGGTTKAYGSLPYEETTTTANNGAAMVTP